MHAHTMCARVHGGESLTLYPDKSGRFSGHHGNQRDRSRQGPARPETDGDSSVGRRCSTGSSSSGAHCVPIRECLYPRERCIAEPANPIWLAQGNRSTSRGAHWFCDHQGPFIPRMNPGAFWPVYGKRSQTRRCVQRWLTRRLRPASQLHVRQTKDGNLLTCLRRLYQRYTILSVGRLSAAEGNISMIWPSRQPDNQARSRTRRFATQATPLRLLVGGLALALLVGEVACASPGISATFVSTRSPHSSPSSIMHPTLTPSTSPAVSSSTSTANPVAKIHNATPQYIPLFVSVTFTPATTFDQAAAVLGGALYPWNC